MQFNSSVIPANLCTFLFYKMKPSKVGEIPPHRSSPRLIPAPHVAGASNTPSRLLGGAGKVPSLMGAAFTVSFRRSWLLIAELHGCKSWRGGGAGEVMGSTILRREPPTRPGRVRPWGSTGGCRSIQLFLVRNLANNEQTSQEREINTWAPLVSSRS